MYLYPRILLLVWVIALYPILAFAYVDEMESAATTLQAYKPIYALLGEPDTKIQLSFKARVVRSMPVYIGYTQLMMWDLFKRSSPFRDINYNPDIFYRLFLSDSDVHTRWLDFGVFEHESNGRDGEDSRSWDRTYLRFTNVIKGVVRDQGRLQFSIRAWFPYNYDSKNQYYARYRGIFEVEVALSNFFESTFEVSDAIFRFYPGGVTYMNPLQGGQELTVRLKLRQRGFLPPFVAQVFHGFAENMLEYNNARWGLRAGIGF